MVGNKKPGGPAIPFQGSQAHDPGECQKGYKDNKGAGRREKRRLKYGLLYFLDAVFSEANF